LFALIRFRSAQGFNGDDGKFGTVQVAATAAIVGIAYIELAVVLQRVGIGKTKFVGRFTRLLI